MSERSEDWRPDLTAIMADDELLDALGRGEQVLTDDLVTTMLVDWRADLAAAVPDTMEDARADPAYPGSDPVAPTVGAGATDLGRPVRRRHRRWAIGIAAAAVGVALVGVGARHAGPGSPLWSVTRVVFPEQADVRAAEEAIDLARTAVRAGRYDDARARLDDATGHLARVRDTESAARLRQDIDDIRRTLADVAPPATSPSGSPPSLPGPTAGGNRAPAERPSAPAAPSSPAPASGSPPSRLPLPPLPLPSLPPLLPSSPAPAPADHGCPLLCPFGQIP